MVWTALSRRNRCVGGGCETDITNQLDQQKRGAEMPTGSGVRRRLLVTGSRRWDDREVIAAELRRVWQEWDCDPTAVLREGECPAGGADLIAKEIWTAMGLDVVPVPADFESCDDRCYHRPQTRNGRNYCPAGGPRRNQQMVDDGADLCVAFVVGASRGTSDCIGRAKRAGIPVCVVAARPVSARSETR